MHCTGIRRQSLGVYRDRRSRRQFDSDQKFEQDSPPKTKGNETLNQSRYKAKRQLKDSRKTSNPRNSSAPLQFHQDQQKRHHRNLLDQTLQFDERSFPHLTNNNNRERLQKHISRNRHSNLLQTNDIFEKEQRQQEIDEPYYLNLTSRSLARIPKTMTKEETYENNGYNSKEYKGARQFYDLDTAEEKNEDASSFLSRRTRRLNFSIRTSRSPSSTHRQELSVTPNGNVQNKGKERKLHLKKAVIAPTSILKQQLTHELEKSCRILDTEKEKNLKLENELQNTNSTERLRISDAEKEVNLKSNNELQNTNTIGRLSRQYIQKLEEEALYYRKEFEAEKEKRQMFEDELEKSRQENQKYAEQMDVLIFEYIPKIVPKFKGIGPVDYNIEESVNSVDSYKLGEILGEGHYGSVRIGTKESCQQKFAVKILNKSSIDRFKDLKQIAIEIHVLKTYRHPNIVYLQEVVHAPESIYMITELCSMDLHKYLNEIGLTIESARQVVYGILKPLCHLHLHGICHLDLKPENILLTKSFEPHNAKFQDVRICDFGLVDIARKTSENKDVIHEGYVCGTPGFYAPEMILQDRFEGRSADMWSLGCIILEITLGFTQLWIKSYDEADDRPDLFKRGLQSCLSEINIQQYPEHASLLDLIHSCLSIDPSKRTRSELALVHLWLNQIEVTTTRHSYSCGNLSTSC